MESVYDINTLNQRIQLLETRQDEEWYAIKDEIDDIKENLKPLTLIRHTVEEINETIGFKSSLVQSAVSIGIGYLAKKLVVGNTHSKVKNIFGSLLQLAVTNLVSKTHEPPRSSFQEPS